MSDDKQTPKREQYGNLEIELTGDNSRDKVRLNDKKLPVVSLMIHSSPDDATVDLECVQTPGGEPYKIEGYLISEEDFDWLRAHKPMR